MSFSEVLDHEGGLQVELVNPAHIVSVSWTHSPEGRTVATLELSTGKQKSVNLGYELDEDELRVALHTLTGTYPVGNVTGVKPADDE